MGWRVNTGEFRDQGPLALAAQFRAYEPRGRGPIRKGGVRSFERGVIGMDPQKMVPLKVSPTRPAASTRGKMDHANGRVLRRATS